jgi:hypothetical protein
VLWSDILINRHLSDVELEMAISKLFSVSTKNILIVDDITEVEPTLATQLLCERRTIKGDFPFVLSIYPQNSNLEVDNLVGQLCDQLEVLCLISDDDLNPFSMMLVQNSTYQTPVLLNPQRFEHDEYVLEPPLSSSLPMAA